MPILGHLWGSDITLVALSTNLRNFDCILIAVAKFILTKVFCCEYFFQIYCTFWGNFVCKIVTHVKRKLHLDCLGLRRSGGLFTTGVPVL